MRQYYASDKKKREEAKRRKKEEKRLKRLSINAAKAEPEQNSAVISQEIDKDSKS